MAACLVGLAFFNAKNPGPADEWINLFDGKTFNGWKVTTENPGTFHIEDGMIVANGDRSHLFYEGDVMKHTFKNFEFKTKIMTTPGSNSGIFIHTEYQPDGWPKKGYEIQVNNTHTDWRKTGSIYAVKDVKETPAKDNEWFTESVTVVGKKITVKINDVVVNELTEEPGKERLSSGTFALQGHDPKSKVFFKDIMVRVLPD
jgi:hypothetical protein